MKQSINVSIFIDYDNFSSRYSNFYDMETNEMDVWETFNDDVINYLQKNLKSLSSNVNLSGTYLCVGMSDQLVMPELAKEQIKIQKEFQKIDQNYGFIVKYGHRTAPYKDKETGKYRLGKEKGVDSEIICQMLMGAFLDHYDIAVIFSDDNDYQPAISRVQDYFSKKVIQAGFLPNSKIRSTCFGHIKLEEKEIFGK
jgi:uncharacterized LabA/DUF88 family protein